jgi:hypothetical protein
MTQCTGITDAAFVHLKGIHILDMSECPNITDNAIVHLKGIYSLNIYGCLKITNASLQAYLQGIHSICTKEYNHDDDDDNEVTLNSILPGTRVLDNSSWYYDNYDNYDIYIKF